MNSVMDIILKSQKILQQNKDSNLVKAMLLNGHELTTENAHLYKNRIRRQISGGTTFTIFDGRVILREVEVKEIFAGVVRTKIKSDYYDESGKIKYLSE